LEKSLNSAAGKWQKRSAIVNPMEKAFSGIRRAFEKPKIDFPWGSNKTSFIRYLSTSVAAAEFLSGVEEQQRVLLSCVSAGRARIVKREFHSFARVEHIYIDIASTAANRNQWSFSNLPPRQKARPGPAAGAESTVSSFYSSS
jgi:hypothetical protein